MRAGEMLTASGGRRHAAVHPGGRGGPGRGRSHRRRRELPPRRRAPRLRLRQLRQPPLHLTCRLKEKKWDARKFLTSSGVISSLSAAVGSLAVAVAQQEGGGSSVFALALVFAAVVMYDASGVRWHTGRQAALLNQIVSDFPPEHPIISTFRPLREPLGHSLFQVFAGALVGCAVAYFMGISL